MQDEVLTLPQDLVVAISLVAIHIVEDRSKVSRLVDITTSGASAKLGELA